MQAIYFKSEVLPLGNQMLRFAKHILGDEEAAKDVIQDTFLKLWQKKDGLGKIDNLNAFVMRMVRNRCLDIIRSRKTTSLDAAKAVILADGAVAKDQQVELSDTVSRVKLLINALPEQQKTVMYLRDIGLQEYDEIAEVTGMNANAIRVNLSRARKKVRDELLKTWKNETDRNKITAAKIF